MSNGEHEIRTPKGLRIGNRSVVDGKNMLQASFRWFSAVKNSILFTGRP